MKLAVVTNHVPHPNGTAAGRQLWAWTDAAIRAGHHLEGWCWSPVTPGLEPPEWCTWREFAAPTGWRVKPQTLMHPRWALAASGWAPTADAVWVDDWGSYPAAASAHNTVLTVHYSVALDATVLHRWSPAQVQDLRAERRAVRRAGTAVALSDRVRRSVGAAGVVPATTPLPAQVLPPVDQPTALLLANWSWPANRVALDQLLREWPDVRSRVAGARLLLAGRHLADVGTMAGVQVLGEVKDPVDAMAQAAVLAFPCPRTSGPKLKVLDAMMHGLPVLTTAAGVEGLLIDRDAAFVATRKTFAAALVDVLSDPARRARVGALGREQSGQHHAPDVAAVARLQVAAAGQRQP